MWFKQLRFYLLPKDAAFAAEMLAEALEDAAFAPVQGLERVSMGFAPPVSFQGGLVFATSEALRVSLLSEERVLPAAVVRDVLEERVAELEDEQARALSKKEKRELKEQITDELLPRAFTRKSRVEAIVDTRRHFLLVNQAAAARAENLLSLLRRAVTDLPAALVHTVESPETLMTRWLAQGAAEGGFELDSDCEMKGHGDAAPSVRFSRQDLTAEEVKRHLDNGKSVTQLGLVWQDKLSFVLTHELTLKRIRFLDGIQEEAAAHGEDIETLTAASQLLMTETLGQMLEELLHHLGGVVEKN